MSRIISGKVRLDVQRVDLAAVVRAAIETVKPAADAKGIRLRPVLDPLAGADFRRSEPAAAGVLEPAEQRGQVHAQGRAGAGRARAGRTRTLK